MKTLIRVVLLASSLQMLPQASAGLNSHQVIEKKCQPMKTSLEVKLRGERGDAERLIKVFLRNLSGADLYVVTDTVRTDGTTGPYWYADQATKGVLVAGFILYEPSSTIFFDHDSASAKLMLLHSSDTYSTQIVAALPIKETVPPYHAHGAAHVFVDSEISGIRVDVAYFPVSEKLRKLFASKRMGVVNGGDFVEYGSSPYSIASSQCIASSPLLSFSGTTDTILHESGHADPASQH